MSDSARKHKAEAPRALRFGVFICSTSRHRRLMKGEHVEDVSGDLIESLLKKGGHAVCFRKTIPDDRTFIKDSAQQALASADVDAIVFCGGTGIASLDVTIERFRLCCRKLCLVSARFLGV